MSGDDGCGCAGLEHFEFCFAAVEISAVEELETEFAKFMTLFKS